MDNHTLDRQKPRREKGFWVAYLLLLPSFALYSLFSYYPFLKTIINSFSVTTSTGEFIRGAGLENWKRVLSDAEFIKTFKNTFVFAILNFVMTFFPALFLALLSTRKDRGSKWYQTLYSMPMAIAATVVAAIWRFILRSGDMGLLNQILGTDINWLKDKKYAMLALAVVSSWGHISGRYIYLMVGFRNVPSDLIEAATIDGAGWWTRTRKIMIPIASPQIFFVLFTSIIASFKTFTQIKLLTGGGPAGATTTLMYSVYTKYNAGQIASSACYALMLFAVIFVASRIQLRFEKKMVTYQ